jgi:parallel beta-helix repeat protein
MKRIALSLTVFLAFLFANSLLIVRVADANFMMELPAIYIKADGSIDPPIFPIKRNGNTYSLTDNITYYKIIIGCDNIVLDGKGFTLKGYSVPIDTAIELQSEGMKGPGRQHVTIRNLKVIGFNMGIYTAYPANCVVTSNTLECFNCVHFSPHCSNNQITNNNFIRSYGRGTCIWIWGSDNVISGNTFTKFRLGIEVFDGENNVISDNYFSDVEEPIELFEASARKTTILKNNIVRHYYYIDSSSPTPTPTITPTPSSSPTPSPELSPSPEPQDSEPFPTTMVIAPVASVAFVGVGLMVYLKRKR